MIEDIILTNHHYLFYIIGSIVFHWTYYIFHELMMKSGSVYNTLHYNKQKYIASNFLKSVMLAGITPAAGYVMYDGMVNDNWNNNLIRNLGILYSIPDTVSLFVVKKMDLTTKVHHSVVCLFNIVSIRNDYTQENVVRCMLVYACFSAFAFIVNFNLAVRFLHENKKIENMLSRAAFLIYSSCCFLNWSWHLKELSTQWNGCDEYYCIRAIPTYTLFIIMIVVDDIKLINWLFYKSGYLTY